MNYLSTKKNALIYTCSQVIWLGVDRNRPAYDRKRSVQSDDFVGQINFGNALLARIYISQVAHMPLLVLWSAVGFVRWIEMSAQPSDAVRYIAKLVYVQTMEARCEIAQFASYSNRRIHSLN
jgi:hypothetical protein